jgi:hypothetical protein
MAVQSAVWSLRVQVPTQLFDLDLLRRQAMEGFAVWQLIPEAGIEGCATALGLW